MSSAQEQIVHTIIEGFKEQRIDALDWLRHKILGALINADAARDAEIARLREALKVYANPTVYVPDSVGRVGDITHVARAALEASHDAKPEGK